MYNAGTQHLFHIDIINVDINKIKIKISMYIMCEIIMKCTITINKYETIVPIVNLWSQVLKIFMQFKWKKKKIEKKSWQWIYGSTAYLRPQKWKTYGSTKWKIRVYNIFIWVQLSSHWKSSHSLPILYRWRTRVKQQIWREKNKPRHSNSPAI